MHPFDYIAATSVDEVTGLLAKHGERARCLVGGTDLLVQLRAGRFDLDVVVDIKSVPEANVLEFDNGNLRMGSAVPCYRVYEDPQVRKAYPGIIDCAELVGGIQIQSRASIGANLCNAAPSGDTICPVIVHNAEAVIAGPNGRRSVPAEDFCTAPGQTVLQRGEWLLELRFPKPPPRFAGAYERFIPRNEMDIAVVGAASAVGLDNAGNVATARVAVAAVAPTPLLVREAGDFLVGKAPTRENFEAAGEIARSKVRPITDMRGTIEQRQHLTKVLTRRTLELAAKRAQEA